MAAVSPAAPAPCHVIDLKFAASMALERKSSRSASETLLTPSRLPPMTTQYWSGLAGLAHGVGQRSLVPLTAERGAEGGGVTKPDVEAAGEAISESVSMA